MIFDTVENMHLYLHKIPKFEKITAAYKEYSISPFTEGKLIIDPELLWANVSKYKTKPKDECKYESHREFCDVQIMFDGEESFGWAPVSECTVTEDFKKGGDIAFYDAPTGQIFTLKKGYFAIFFPGDAHAPCIKSPGSDSAHKLVFKVKL